MSDLPHFLASERGGPAAAEKSEDDDDMGVRGIWVDGFRAVRSKAFLPIDGGAGVAGCEDGVVVGV
jgi:hypothetical protein